MYACCVHCTAHIVYKHGMHDELYSSYEKQRYELQYLHGLNLTNFLVFNYYQNWLDSSEAKMCVHICKILGNLMYTYDQCINFTLN